MSRYGRWRVSIQAILGLGLLAGTASCATHADKNLTGNVDFTTIRPTDVKTMELASDEVFVRGKPIDPVTMPQYPMQLVSKALPDQHVCVKIVVEADGSVSTVTPFHVLPGCPAAGSDIDVAFVEAVRQAVARWEFFSSQVCKFPLGTPDKDKCSGKGVTITQVPITQAYEFLFSQKTGVSSVIRESGATK